MPTVRVEPLFWLMPIKMLSKSKVRAMLKANEVYANAFGRDPEFAKFYRSLDAYRSSFL